MTLKSDKISESSILVIGADSDIGTALINHLDGNIIAHHYLSADTLATLNSGTRTVTPIYGDFSSLDGIRDFIGKVKAIDRTISKIVHLPSSPAIPSRLSKFDPENFIREINIQVISAAMIFSEFLPPMAKREFGRVSVMLTSYCIGVPPKYLTGYVSAKYALMGLMKSIAAEYAGKGITVNAIAPSMTMTKFLSSLPDFEIESSARLNPMGRNAVTEDLVPIIKMLLNDDNSFMTGAIIPVTGGSALY